MTDRADEDRTAETDQVPEEPQQPPEQPKAPSPQPRRRAGGRRSRLPKVLLGVLVAVAIVAVAYGAYRFLWQPSPQRILTDMLNTYRGASSFTAEGTVTIEMDLGGSQIKNESPISLAYLAPNLLYADYGEGMQAGKTVCDGDKIYMEVGFLKKAVAAPAPASLKELPSGATMCMPGQGEGGLFDMEALTSGDAQSELVESVAAGIDPEREWLSGLTAPGGCWAITVTPKAGPPVALWVDRRSHLVRQAAVEVSAEDMAGEAGLPEMPEGPAGGMAEMFRNMKYRMLVAVSDTSVTKPPPEDRFKYTPPAGIEVVAADSMQDMSGALMGGDMPGIPEERKLEGQSPPDFTAQDLHGKSGSLSSFKGKPLVLDFWATWCPPCRDEMPTLEQIYQALHDEGLEIVAVSSDSSIEAVEEFCQETPVSFRVIWLPPERAREVSEAYGITGIPRTLYITKDWKIKVDTTGLHSKQKMLEHIAELGIDTSSVR